MESDHPHPSSEVQLGARHLGTYGPARGPDRVVGEMGPAEGAFVLGDLMDFPSISRRPPGEPAAVSALKVTLRHEEFVHRGLVVDAELVELDGGRVHVFDADLEMTQHDVVQVAGGKATLSPAIPWRELRP